MITLKHAVLSLVAATAISGVAFAADMKKKVGAGEGEVDIVAWAG